MAHWTVSFAQPVAVTPRAQEELYKRIVTNQTFREGFTGFQLVDVAEGEEIFSFHADHYFTPASNTKLFSTYVAERVINGVAPALLYRESGDTVHLWGTAYPLLYHPFFAEFDSLRTWLENHPRQLVVHHPPESEIPRYGKGWSWDDFNDGYVYERSAFPVYANSLVLRREPYGTGVEILPPGFAKRLLIEDVSRPTAARPEMENRFTVSRRALGRSVFEVQRPLVTSAELTASLLVESLGRPVTIGEEPYPTTVNRPADGSSAFSLPVGIPDTVYRRVLQNSDNFLAEQLLLLAAAKRYGQPDLPRLLAYARDTLLAPLKIIPRQWVDGSGLSRYNQFTPRQVTDLLRLMLRDWGVERTKDLLATGGVNGTLERYFGNGNKPYLWAKTGSLRNVLCVSGMVEARSGKTFVFSFMHNNFPGRGSDHYREMESVMKWVYENL